MKTSSEHTAPLPSPESQPEKQAAAGNGTKQTGKPTPMFRAIVNVISDFFLSLLNGTFLTKENMLKSIPFFFYLTFLAIIYIANTYYAEKMVRITDRTRNELKELRYEHITTRSQLMSLSKQSEVVKRMIGTGLKESVVPPEKIFIKTDAAKKESPEAFWLPNTTGK